VPRLRNFYQNNLLEAGCDEAGRGALAGPVYAAAVILPEKFSHPLLNDSKKMTAGEREEVKIYIEKNAIAFSVASVSEREIDQINILQASIKAMHLALEKLSIQPEFILIDGNRFRAYKNVKHQCIIEGDAKYKSIAAASVLAKTYRDDFMKLINSNFPLYGWDQNKGYGTPHHRSAIKEFGRTEFHRQTFLFKDEKEIQPELFSERAI